MSVRVLLAASASTLVIAVLAGVVGAQPPPRDLQLVGDHWTAWNPPPVPEGVEPYIIQPGDTLWDLAGQFYGDPYLWPQLWEQNRYILDARWIYPGDPLIVGAAPGQFTDTVAGPPLGEGDVAEGTDATALADGELEDDPFADIIAPADEDISSRLRSELSGSDGPVPLGFESDIYCSGYIGPIDEAFPYRVSGSEYDFQVPDLSPQEGKAIEGIYGRTDLAKYGLSMGDVVYIDRGRADGVSAGELFTAILPGAVIRHPLTRNAIGRFYQYVGRVRVLSTQETTSIAEVTLACDGIPVGSMLKAFAPEPVPLRRLTPMRPVNFPVATEALVDAPVIVHADDDLVTLAAGHLVYIDRGMVDDVAPGDIYTIYRRAGDDRPPLVLGEVAVLSVHESTSLARILRNRFAVYRGDVLHLK
ncbi:MAG: LysM peptidoglycan-binding domain-containing protein [Acidobacteriota bacterium]